MSLDNELDVVLDLAEVDDPRGPDLYAELRRKICQKFNINPHAFCRRHTWNDLRAFDSGWVSVLRARAHDDLRSMRLGDDYQNEIQLGLLDCIVDFIAANVDHNANVSEDFRYGGYTSTGAGKPDGSTPARRGDVAKNLRRSAEFPYDRDNSYGAPRLTGFDGQANIDMGGHQQLTPMDTSHTPWDDDTGEIDESVEWTTNDPLDPDAFEVFLDELEQVRDREDKPVATPEQCVLIDRYIDAVAAMINSEPPYGDSKGIYGHNSEINSQKQIVKSYLTWFSRPDLDSDIERRVSNDPYWDVPKLKKSTLSDFRTALVRYAVAVRQGRPEKWNSESIDYALDLLEAAGTPYMLGKASNTPGSNMGTIPGTAGGWANSPFDQEIDDDELERAGKQKDESAWDVLSADGGMGEDGLSPLDLEIDAARSDFRSMFDDSLETYDEPRDLMLVLLGADPEYAVDVLAPEEPERMRDLYLRWGDDVCPAEDNS